MSFDQSCLIALGANLPTGDASPEVALRSAVARMDGRIGRITALSRIYRTPCFPPGAGPDYVNAAVAIDTHLTPREILAGLHEIEADFGRERKQRWGARTLDLDLLAVGDQVLPDRTTQQEWMRLPPDERGRVAPQELILPHPRLQERAFVLVPLADVAPDWRHPVLRQTVREMCDALPETDRKEVIAIA